MNMSLNKQISRFLMIIAFQIHILRRNTSCISQIGNADGTPLFLSLPTNVLKVEREKSNYLQN
jgi:hypothetical protein